MLNTQIIFQTVRKNLVDQDTSDLEILLEFISELHLILVGLKRVGVGVGEIDIAEKVEERFSLDLLGYYSLLSCLFILLFFLDLLESKVLSRPFNHRGFRFDRSAIPEVKLLGKFLILDDLIFLEGKDYGEVVRAFLIDNVDIIDGIEELIVIFSHVLLDDS